ncbi:PKD domain-containing protein [Flavobacterium humidisoli]|uniref:Gliding motility-associated C-terminal domain-containing protein n=1 Tax=Flavobacterium humidisoli TaxID=2937442 RepID=A0ABY4M290_9FLAO|nr:gliding motility-associated C-terminal domain-containing protein [Flavobacterium humidisoli]UPZ17966.1 gliding motility-associated C-terminal domain-containing protein [Flavobacterium humidisoli]
MEKNYSYKQKKSNFSNLFLSFLVLVAVLFSNESTYGQDCSLNAGIPITICENSPLLLSGVVGGNMVSHKWTQIAGPSVLIQDPNSAVTSVLGAVGGNVYRFRLSGVCSIGTTSQDVTITVNPITIAKAGTNIEGCPGTYPLSANSPLNPGETGIWVKNGSDNAGVTINNPTSPNATITLSSSAAGSTQLSWKISSSSCSSSSSITVTNYGGEVIANAGPDQTLSECYTNTQSTILNASIGGNGTGKQEGTWSFVSGPAVPTITNPNSENAAVSDLIEGPYVFRWAVQGPCVLGSDTVTINVPPATQDVTDAEGINRTQSFCDKSITSTVLQGNIPLYAGETVEWSTNSGATIVSPNSSTTLITGLDFNTKGTYTFIYKIKGNSEVNPKCETQSTFTVQYVSSPTALILNNGVSTVVLPVNVTSGSIPMSSTGGNDNQYIYLKGPDDVMPSLNFDEGNLNFSNLTKAGTYTFRVRRYTSGSFAIGCLEAFADISIVVSLSPEPSNAGTKVALLCGVTTTQLSGNNPTLMTTSGLSGYWSQVSGPNVASFDDIKKNNPNISNLISGVYVFRWNISGGINAIDTFSETSITVSQPPFSNAGETPVTACAGSYFLDAAPLIEGQTGHWTQLGGAPIVTIVNPASPQTYINGMLPGGTYTFRWTVTAAGINCTPSWSDVVVNTIATFSPSPAVAGSDFCLPSGTTRTTLSAANAVNGTGTWAQIAGSSVSIVNPNSADAAIEGLTDGIYKFQWTTAADPLNSSLCTSFSDTITITVAAEPKSIGGTDQDVCGNIVIMNANVLTTGLVGTWVQVSGDSSWSVDDINNPKAVFSNLAAGNYVFKWVVRRGTCDSDSSEVSFKVSLPPTVATVSTGSVDVCDTKINLNGNTITSGAGTWQVVSGPNNPVFANANIGNTAVSGLTTGTYLLRWSSTNGPGCATSTADLTLNVNAPADAGPDQVLCNATEIMLQGTKGSTGIWTVNSGNGATITPLSSSTARATIVPGNNYAFQYSISSADAGSCGASSDIMTVTNSALPTTPNAGIDQEICLSEGNSITLSGNSITSGSGIWSKVSGPVGGTISSNNSNSTTVIGLTEGLYIFKWTAGYDSCNNLSDVIRVNVYGPPSAADAGADQSACQLGAQLDAAAPTSGIGTWTLTAGPSLDGIIIDSPNDPKSTLSFSNPYLLPVGTYTFTWTVKNGTICAVSTDTVNITFTGAPPTPANAGPDQNLCNATTAVMNANPVNPGTGTWTQVSGPTTAIFSNRFSAHSTVSALTNGTYEFKWSSSNGAGCNLEDTILVTINPAIAAVNAGPDQILAEYSTVTMAATDPAPNTGSWSFVSGPNTPFILDVNSPTTQIAGTIPGKYVFKYTVSNSSCAVDADTVEITLIGQTDLSLAKIADIASPRVGDIVTFTVAVTNNGNRDATGIAVRDNLPAGFTLITGSVSNQGNYNAGGNAINWSGLSVVNGATLNLTYKARVNAATGTANEYTNTAQITASDQVDPNSTPNNDIPTEDDQDSLTLTPIPNVDLAITKRISNATPDVGSTVQFTIEVVNNGPSNATSVVATDALPTGYTFVSATAGTGTYNSTNGRWNIGNLANGSRTTLTITARVNATGNYTNTATVTRAEIDTNATNNTSSVSSTPRAIADLSLTKTVSAGPYNVGSNVTFTVTVTNAGPSAATSVSVLDYLPSGYTYVSHTSAGTTYSNASGFWNIGNLANGASAVLTVVARINATGDYRNVAEVVHSNEFDPDSTPGNNNPAEDDQQQVVIVPVQLADLEVTKTVDVTTPRVGDNIKFRITLRNVGPSDATGVTVNDLLPTGYTFVSYTSTNGAYNATNGNWTISGSVANGKTEYLDITAKVNPITGTANEFRNTASVTASNQTDPVPANNTSTVTTVPTALINLALTKSVNNISPLAGSNVVFTVRVSNAGPSNATGVQVRDLLPNGYTYVSSTVSNGTYANGTGLWTIGTIINGASAVLNVTATVNATGNYTNVAEVISANETDVNSTPNNNVLTEDDQDEIAISRGSLVDLSLVKTVNNNTPNVNDIVTFRITVNNAGPSDAKGVVVTDKLPSGYLFVSAAPSAGSYNNTPGSWTVGTLANGATATLDIQARVLPTGNYNNVAEVTGADEVDSNSTPGNNDDTENDQSEVIVTPVQIADLSVNKIVDVTVPKVGDNVVFTIAVSNAGPSNATGVVIRDLLPSGYEFVSAVPTAGMYNRTTGDWTVSRPIIANTSETIQITAKVLKNGSYVNNAEVIASDQQDPDSTPNDGTGDDFSTVTTTPSALVNLAVVKRINNAAPDVGSTVVFTIDVVNNGPSDATTVVVNDRLPTGYAFVSDDATGNYDNVSGNWIIGNLASGIKRTLNITAAVNPKGNYLNTATATSTETDGNPGDNTCEVSSTPRAISDLSLLKTVANASPNVGENAVFTIVVTNNGPSNATGVVVTDQLPSGYSFVSATPSVGTFDSNSGGWSVGSLANSASASLTIIARVLATGNYNNVAEVTGADQFDPNSIPGNNNPLENDQSTVVVTPVNVSDLVTVKTVSAVTVAGISASRPNEGDTIRYSIVVTNNGGPTSATGVSLTDILPAGLTYESHTVTAGTYNYASGVWTIGNLAVNGTAALEITAKVNAGTKGLTIINRTTAAKGDQTDPTTAGDDLEETIVVSLPPIAANDISNGNTTNQPSTPLNILTNDRLGDGTLATPANTIVDLNPNTPGVETTIIVPGEGTWNYDPATGLIVFTPEAGFTSDPTPLVYKLTETQTGLSDTATITVTYVAQAPIAYNDLSSGNPVNTAVTVNPLANKGSGKDADPDGTIDPSTVRLLSPSGATAIVTDSKGITSFDVANEGKWSVNPVTGAITFTPLPTFHKDPTPIQYNVKDNDGNVSNNATVTIDYVPVAANDRNTTPGTPGLPVTINVSGNDTAGDTVNVSTVVLNASSVFGGIQVSPQEVSVAGVGNWIADALGNVTFTPEAGYTIDPPVISYTIRDNQGNSSNTATITIDYAPITSPDLSIGNPINTPVVVDVTANDTTGDLVDPTTVSLVNPGNGTNIVQDPTGDITSITIPEEGRWNLDPVTGKVTFTPNPGFITNPTPINYNVRDHQGNQSNNSLITIRVIPQADMVVTKTNHTDKYIPGTNSVYTITVKNNGPAAATNVVVLDDIADPVLKAVTTWSVVGTGGTILPYASGAGGLNFNNATIRSINTAETVTYTVTIAVPSSYTGKIVNTAIATSAVQDPNVSNNAQTDIDTANPLAEIVLTKTILTAAPHRIGDNVEFLITAVNNGPSDATGINIVDKLPSGYTFVSARPSNGTYNASSGLWNLGGLTNTSNATLTVIARINATGNYTNVAEVTKVDQLDPNGVIHGNNTPNEIDQSDVTIVPVKIVDLVTTKTVDKSNPNKGDIVQYTITVVNNGPSTATGVNLTDNLPAGLVYVSHVAAGGTINMYAGGVWNIGNINIGSSAALLINARVTAAGTVSQTPIVNTVTSAAGNESDPTTAGDDLTESIIVTSSDLVTEKTVSKSNPSEGETINYSIRVTNNGPSDATGVRLTDILPIGVTYVSNNQGADYNYGSGIWTIGDLANGATKVLDINVLINSGSAGKTIVNTTTAAKGDQSDPSAVGDDLTETIIVQNGADVVLKKVVNNSTPNIGETVTYTVTVTNKGTTLVTNLVVKDDLPAGLTFVSATPGKGVWTTPNWTVGTLQPGEEGSIEIKALVGLDQGGNVLTNTVSNTQDQFDANRTPDYPTETITVTNLDLAVVKTVNNATPNEGEVIRYTIRVTNNGANDATNVSLVDKLPVGVTYVSDALSAGNYNNGSGLWTIGNLVNGAVATLTIDARVNAGTYGTTITNTTSAVKADQADSNPANNIASVAIVPTAYIDLSLTKDIVGNIINPAVGDVITFEIRVMNDGPTKATGVEVVDLVPSGYKFINYSSTIGTYSPSTGLWKVGFVEPGNTAVLLVDVRVLDTGDYMNCAEITKVNEPDIDSTPGNGNVSEDDYACASASPNQSLGLAVVKTILKNVTNPKVNSQISFEIQLTNNGDIDATGVVVSDLLPSGYRFVNYSSTRGVYDYVTGDWIVGKILNGETEILIVDVIVNESGNYQNCASIKAMHQTDIDPSNNQSCITASPIALIDLELTKEADILKPIAETNVEFTITLSNKGPSKATGVEVKDLLPSGFKFVSAVTAIGTYDAVTGIWKVGTIDTNALQILKVTANVLPTGDFTNVAEVMAANEDDVDSAPGNNKLQEDDQDAVSLEPQVSLMIPEGFTPNGDGINDVFEIEHLQVLYPNFSIEIVNRYGNLVYKYKHNGDKFTTPLWWDGYSTGRLNVSGGMLPAGTYFYTIHFNNNERNPQTGWLHLKK